MTKRTHTFLMAEIAIQQMMDCESVAASYSFKPTYQEMTKELSIACIVASVNGVTAAWRSATTLIVPEMAGSKKSLSRVNAMYRTVMKSMAKHIERAAAF